MIRTSPTHTTRRIRGGFSLLEVMLAVSLSAVVLAAVNTAIHIHLRVSTMNRGDVAEAQLARALLDRIAQDLRGAVAYQLPDPEEIAVAYPADATEETDSTEEGDAEEVLATDEDEEEAAEGIGVTSVPGLLGTTTELQVDTCRLPRADELANALNYDLGVANQLSDVKTVTYYCVGYEGSTPDPASGLQPTDRGLVRREFDRAAATFLAANAATSVLNQGIEPIAPEVYSIEFHYFDETTAYETWDSNEMEGLPFAVEIILKIVPSRVHERLNREASQSSLSQPTLDSDDRLLVYRKVVRLPAARVPLEETALEETGDIAATEEGTAEE